MGDKEESAQRKERRRWHKRLREEEENEELQRLALESATLESRRSSSNPSTSYAPEGNDFLDMEERDATTERSETGGNNKSTDIASSDLEDDFPVNLTHEPGASNQSTFLSSDVEEDLAFNVTHDLSEAEDIVTDALKEGNSYSSDSSADPSISDSESQPSQALDLSELYSLLNDIDEEETKQSSKDPLAAKLAVWTIEHNVVHRHVDDLLQVLRSEGHPKLPLQCKTLLKTPKRIRQEHIVSLANGALWYQGVLKGMAPFLSDLLEAGQKLVTIDVFVDGASPYKSVRLHLWPIVGSIVGSKVPCLFIIALWCGTTKDPKNLGEFLKDFVAETKKMMQGFHWNGQVLKLRVRRYIADAPARAFLRAVKSHNSYGSCERCSSYGQWQGRVIFPVQAHAEERTDDSFASRLHPAYHLKDSSPLEELGTGMVTQFPLDGMHLLYLGVMKKLISMLFNDKKPSIHKLNDGEQQELSNLVTSYAAYCPSEFSRKPRPFIDWKLLKAHELRRILLYDGILIYSLLPQVVSQNFLLFHCAIRILSDKTLTQYYDDANYLLNKFVEHAARRSVYGPTFLVYNVHHLTHFADECVRHGPIEDFSAFQFENFIGVLKNMIHAPGRTLPQIIARILERAVHIPQARQQPAAMSLDGSHSAGPVHDDLEGQQFSRLSILGTVLSLSRNDSCCVMESGEIVEIKNFVKSVDGQVWIVGKSYYNKEDMYEYPMKSSVLGIYKVSRLMMLQKWKIEEVRRKCMRLPLPRGNENPKSFLCIPMLQDVSVETDQP